MFRYHLNGEWVANPDPVRFTIKRFNENMTQNFNNGVAIITEPGYYTVTAYFHAHAAIYTQIMKNYNIVDRIWVQENFYLCSYQLFRVRTLNDINKILLICKFLNPMIGLLILQRLIVDPSQLP